MSQHRDNEVDLKAERQKRRPEPVVGRLFRRWGNLRIGKPNRRVEVRRFPTTRPHLDPAS